MDCSRLDRTPGVPPLDVGTAIPQGSGGFLKLDEAKIHTVDTDVKTIIFFGACLLVILILGTITEKKGTQEEAEGGEPHVEERGGEFLRELHQIEN